MRFSGCPSLEIFASNEDISIYIDGHLEQLSRFILDNQDLQKHIKSAIILTVKGM